MKIDMTLNQETKSPCLGKNCKIMELFVLETNNRNKFTCLCMYVRILMYVCKYVYMIVRVCVRV